MTTTKIKSISSLLNSSFQHTPRILLKHESHALLVSAASSNFRDYIMIKLALGTGLRNSELCGLTVECIAPYDVVSNILDVPESIAKGGHPRQIPLHPDIRRELEEWLDTKQKLHEPCGPVDFLFVSLKTHSQLSPRDFQRIVRNLSITSIGRPITPHTLRHTFATRLLAQSNMRIVQQVLGHLNIQSTQIYTHPSSSEISDAINKL